MENSLVDGIRQNSRALVRSLGFLRPSLAGTQYPASCVHALIELGQKPSMTIVDLGRILDLDKSTSSRIVQKLVSAGEAELRVSEKDAREKQVRLTRKGRSTLAMINQFGNEQVVGALSRLPQTQHAMVGNALEMYARALEISDVPSSSTDISIVEGYRPGLIGRVTELHAMYYRDSAGFGVQFEAAVAAGLADFMKRLDRPVNRIWSIDHAGRISGSIAVDGEDLGDGIAHLRWFIIDGNLRGRGLGRQLIESAVRHCKEQGFASIALWTLPGLEAARQLYLSYGFEQVGAEDGSQWGERTQELKFVKRL